MKIKLLMIFLSVILLGYHLSAVQSSVTFLKNGDTITDTIVDMSSQTGQVEFRSHAKIHRSRIWMINFVGSNWDFPAERQLLVSDRDTVFLRNGQRLNVNIVDFSSRRRMFEFRVGGRVHEDKVKRIYFCCTKLPDAYKKKVKAVLGEFSSVTFMVDGRIIDSPLSYLNSRKTGFQDGLQVNTKDIWMINFEDDSLDFPRERVQLSNKVDTIFPVKGRVFYDIVVGFDGRTGRFSFQRSKPIHYSQITRIYFCCTKFPEAFKSRRRYKRLPPRIKRRY